MIAIDMNATVTPTYELRIGGIAHPAVTIHRDGHITLAEDLSLDEASREFWSAMESLAPGTCKRILTERGE
jgi:hypothetical protein